MSDQSGLEALLDADPGAGSPEVKSAFPHSAGSLLDRLGSLYGLERELEPARGIVDPLAAVPVETSVSLRPAADRELRLTLGIPRRPDARRALVAALSALGVKRFAAPVDEALATVAPAAERRLARGLALRARRGEPVRPRPATWVGGHNASERSAAVADALLQLGLDHPAALHRRISTRLAANPFCAVTPYGLGFDLGPDGVGGAKTYWACEWPDVALEVIRGGLAEDLRTGGVEAFELLAASARAERRRARWLLELSFELPADPGRGARIKAYVPPADLASNEVEGHAAVLRLGARLGLDARPYRELVGAIRPDGPRAERPCSLMIGLSASARGLSLEAYLFAPTHRASSATWA